MKSSFSFGTFLIVASKICTIVHNLGVHCCSRLLVAGIVVFKHGA